MVCMIFIVHTIAAAQHVLKMCSPDEYDYSLKGSTALARFLDERQLPVDNSGIENQIRPIAIGRTNWLFAGSLRAGQRAAAVMNLIQSVKLSGHEPSRCVGRALTCSRHKTPQQQTTPPCGQDGMATRSRTAAN
jgi:hypothetical protein